MRTAQLWWLRGHHSSETQPGSHNQGAGIVEVETAPALHQFSGRDAVAIFPSGDPPESTNGVETPCIWPAGGVEGGPEGGPEGAHGVTVGDCLEELRRLPEDSVDAVVTDPPYGIRFMGEAWDGREIEEQARANRRDVSARTRLTGSPDSPNRRLIARTGSAFQNRAGEAGSYDFSPTGNRAFQEWCEAWGRECLRVLKPGGHLLSFGGTRTFHRLVCGLEDAGFEIRDCVVWLYGKGFPKSHNLTGEWEGWGTALKPGHEPIVVARKRPAGTIAANVLRYGTGALNIAATRLGDDAGWSYPNGRGGRGWGGRESLATNLDEPMEAADGRWPPNVLLSHHDDCHEDCPIELSGAARFFYVAKASRAEREAGLEPGDRNQHPTVKPLGIMRWLVRLAVPPGGVVVDPFLGSGTTAIAAELEGFRWLGIEREAGYARVAEARLAFWREHGEDGVRIASLRDGARRRREEAAEAGQLDLFAPAQG